MLTAVLSGATLGLLNMAHCAAMCGPLSSAVSLPAAGQRPIRYQLGRLISYGFLGAMSGHLGRALRLSVPGGASVWIVATLTAAACLLTARSLLRPARSTSGLVQLQTRPRRRSLFAMFAALVPKEPLVLGLLSALLPCGVLASALLTAAATGEAWSGMQLMFTFAAVSGVAVWSAGMALQLAPRRFAFSAVRRVLAVALVALAGFTLYRPLRALRLGPDASVEHAACHGSTP
jgi:sulfite exporter TauE/SafE